MNITGVMSVGGAVVSYMHNPNSQSNKRHLNEKSPKGKKVKFLGRNGRGYELIYAKKIFELNQILTVKEIFIDDRFATVEFMEYPGLFFNTVMFKDLTI